ncbi:putative dna mismatch repair protein pms1 [Phaeomoniella chlamydospora]|uniref:Putative dna mismatch repair protein pms1 n=1 Tax=Phaeomoniella chlamydospora TaxID=158046 RepID=A0A0G2G172_PHACM|nr:putative dna mismatch repair protein pms1 [Phaeomoniella chlamydospora]
MRVLVSAMKMKGVGIRLMLIALKHYTSKLSTYEDLTGLQTFGFRGEALSSLCALSRFHIVTAQAHEAPKGKRLDFEASGKLKDTQVVACQQGTTAVVEDIFGGLPVRRKELAKNIKREYGKVIGLLHAYACVSTGIKFIVKNLMPKGKSAVVFSTRGNKTTRENIANIYGAKTLPALLSLELELEFASSTASQKMASTDEDGTTSKIIARGHISRPIFGEGRQTPDRQMFFVNSRPCGLPQITKAINEVYKSFNVSQSPFVFVDLRMDTKAYDVNVSPDKRTILLHDSANLIESLKSSLVELFEQQDQTVPQAQLQSAKLPGYKQLTLKRSSSTAVIDDCPDVVDANSGEKFVAPSDTGLAGSKETPSLLHEFFRNQISPRPETSESPQNKPYLGRGQISKAKERAARRLGLSIEEAMQLDDYDEILGAEKENNVDDGEISEASVSYPSKLTGHNIAVDQRVRDFNTRLIEQRKQLAGENESRKNLESPLTDVEQEGLTLPKQHPNMIQKAFDRMRPKQPAPEVATITVGDKTITTLIGSPSHRIRRGDDKGLQLLSDGERLRKTSKMSGQGFSRNLRGFAVPGTQIPDETDSEKSSDASATSPAVTDQYEASVDSSAALEAERSSSRGSKMLSVDESGDEGDGGDQEKEQDTDEGEAEKRARDSMDGEQDNFTEASESENVETGEVEDSDDIDPRDTEYLDENEEKAQEKARVANLIRQAEEKTALNGADKAKRVTKIMRSGTHKDSTVQLSTLIDGSIDTIEAMTGTLTKMLREYTHTKKSARPLLLEEETAEERLSLTVSKSDFSNMRIIGQFNLGFILAVRPSVLPCDDNFTKRRNDELFIIDQHASDEKYNFERLQQETVVGNQRLVLPKPLELTAVEEEIIIENVPVLEKNGFLVDIDISGDEPIGQRCKLISLPLSKEVVFDTRDLEELIHLLSETPPTTTTPINKIPRPSKVRKMFAMRACRSSIMIGKTLTVKQMQTVVRHMGEMDKPWNCPHGRPTMRHLMSLDGFESWMEGDGLVDDDHDKEEEKVFIGTEKGLKVWDAWAA